MSRMGVWILAVAAVATACERAADAPEPAVRDSLPAGPTVADERIEIQLRDSTGTHVGVSHLSRQGTGVEVHVRVSGLEPGSVHGFHIHETGTCTPPSFESAGGHFNPTGAQHGADNPRGPHAGDLPNITAGPDGVADTTFVKRDTRLRGDSTSLQRSGGLALVVHAGRDDMRTDPAGDAGRRIACGVLRVE